MARTELTTSPAVNAEMGFPGPLQWLLFLAFCGLVAAAVATRNVHFAIGSLLPAAVFGGIVLGRPKNHRLEFGETGLSSEDPQDELPYDAICGLTVNSAPYLADAAPRGVVRVMTCSALIELPRKIDRGQRELVRAILDRIPLGGGMPDQSTLAEFARSQREQFGDERVWTYRVVDRCRGRSELRFVGWGLVLVGLAWIGAAIASAEPAWGGGAVFALLTAALIAVYATQHNRHQTLAGKRWRESGLVIAPTALAMIQGDLKGKLGWHEIKSVKFVRQRLSIEIAGATFVIPDFYDRPIQQIVELLRFYVGSSGAAAGPAIPRSHDAWE